MLFFTICISIFALYAIVLEQHLWAWGKIETKNNHEHSGVSVLIVARNEGESIGQLLESIKHQSFRAKIEILVVDDNSEDNTAQIAQSFENVRYHKLNAQSNASKKEAIEWAAANCTYSVLLQTDADCFVGPEWIESIVSKLGGGIDVVLGPVSYSQAGGIWNELLVLEMRVLSFLAGSSTALGDNFLSNAANMAYRKNLINELNPYKDKSKPSGDDSFLVNAVSSTNDESIRFCKNSKAIVETPGPVDFAEFFNQRLRWASKVNPFGNQSVNLHALVLFSLNLLLVVLTFYPMGISKLLWLPLAFTVKCLLDFRCFKLINKFYGQNGRVSSFWTKLLLVIIFPYYSVIFAFLSKFVAYRWKGRTISPWKK